MAEPSRHSVSACDGGGLPQLMDVPMRKRKHTDAVLEHLATYWMGTYPSVTNTLEEPGDVENTMSRLRDDGLIASAKLYPEARKEIYFHLTETGAHLIGSDRGEAIRDPRKRAECFGVLQFCCYGPQLRHKLTRDVFDEWLPGYRAQNAELQRRFPSDNYFIDESDPTYHRLGRILVVVPPPDFLNKLRYEHLDKTSGCFPDFFDADRFSFAVVTSTKRAATLITKQLEADPLMYRRRPVPVHVEHYPALIQLFAKPTEKKANAK